MNERKKRRQNTLALALHAALLGALAGSGPAFADGAELDAMRDRMAELERTVQMLLEERERTRSELRRMEAETETVVDQVVAERVTEAMSEAERARGDEPHRYSFGGYVKSDLMLSSYSDGDLPVGNIGRDFYVPSTVPVGGEDESTHLDFHARETRFFLKSDHRLENGMNVGTYIELDFLVTAGGNERVSNSFVPRMRHAFVKTNDWLVGQTWSTFQNVGALAENLDFVGPAEGTVFERQPMIRYTKGPWQVAVENPETTVTPFGGGGRIVTDDGAVPDLIARYEPRGDWGHFAAAAIVRQLAFEDRAAGIDDDTIAYGLSLSGLLKIGDRDDFRWMATVGSGLGRYVGVNIANGAVLDEEGSLETIESYSGFASYRHFWSPKWRSNLTLSYFDEDNDTDLTGFGLTNTVYSVHANLLYEPLPKYLVGVEYMHANREIESGEDGSLDRLQFSVRYSF